jgi:hypothetical protein
MKISVGNAVFKLEPQQIVTLRGARGVRLRGETGLLWVTQEGSMRDDFLRPGSELSVQSDGAVLIEAMCPSSLTLSEAAVVQAASVRARPASPPGNVRRIRVPAVTGT